MLYLFLMSVAVAVYEDEGDELKFWDCNRFGSMKLSLSNARLVLLGPLRVLVSNDIGRLEKPIDVMKM